MHRQGVGFAIGCMLLGGLGLALATGVAGGAAHPSLAGRAGVTAAALAHPSGFFHIPDSRFLTAQAVYAGEDAGSPAFYTERVKPILDTNCARCHTGMNHRGGLSLSTRESMLKGGHHGPAIVPGDPDHSLLVTLIRHAGPADDPMDMPPRQPKLSDADIATVAQWIKAGAVMPPPIQP